MTADERSPLRLLARQFFRRFFDNDLVSPGGDGHEHLSTLLAIVAVPGLFASAFLLLGYTSPLLSPGERLLVAIPHKFLLLGCSVCVMALVACVEWDALSLDARDRAILGPLPISTRVVVTAKLAAIAAFAGLFAVAANAIPAVAFPLVFLSTVPISLGRALWILGVHASVLVLASLFGFGAILALRETTRLLAGGRLFRLMSPALQFTAVLGLSGALLLLPAIPSSTTMNWLESRDDVSRWVPPMWFVGLEETLTAGTILNAPGMEVPAAGRFWTVGRDRRARAAYAAKAVTFDRLAAIGVIGFATSVGLALLVLLAEMRWNLEGDTPGSRAWRRVPIPTLLARLLARHPARQAGLAFTLQTLSRSPEHRLHLAAYLATGAATALVLVGPSLRASATSDVSVPPRLYAVQMILSFFIIAGLKAVFARPAALSANWVFQLCWTNEDRRYRSGVRRAIAVTLAAFLLLLVPLHAIWFNGSALAAHFMVGWIAALAAVEIAVLDRSHIPFTCATVSTGSLKKWWPAYLVAFLSYTFGIGALERRAFETTVGTEWLIGALAVCYLLILVAGGVGARRPRPMTFEEPPDLTQELGLGKT